MIDEAAGAQLRAAREERGLSVEDMAGKLKIPARYVVALESGDASVLPEPTFVRGYVKAYAKAVGLDADVLLVAFAPVELKAPRPLVGVDGQAGAARRAGAAARAPSFRNNRRRLWIPATVLALGGVVWALWPTTEKTDTETTVAAPSVAAPAAIVAQPAAEPAPVMGGGVTLAVPLPGVAAADATPAPGAPAAAGAVVGPNVVAVPLPATAGVAPAAPAGGVTTTAAAPAAANARVAAPGAPAVAATGPLGTTTAGTTVASQPAPRKGLHVRFNNTCWIEVRDADNVVLYSRIATPGSDMTLEGKAPLTVTLGDGAAAQVFYNGDRVVADRFSSNGIARIIVGNATR